MYYFLTVLLFLNVLCKINGHNLFQPEQIHLAYGKNKYEIVVTWSTPDKTNESIVEYGIGEMIYKAYGNSIKFVDEGSAKHTQYVHRVLLSELAPNSKYVYHCGSHLGWSSQFWFSTPPNLNWSPHLAIFGDMGSENAQSLSYLQEETQRGLYDAILHVGDFAYDMDSENGLVGDYFMKQIESIAAYLPYMVCPGNHEERYNFSHYKNRFSMPGDTESLMYSFDMGPIHFIGISTEVYYFINYGLKSLIKQYQWLENDLQVANRPENRAERPWIVIFGHRPMYCSDTDGDDCTNHETVTRVGLPFFNFFGLEDLFYKNGVDLCIWAHEHTYERLFPIYNYQVFNGSYNEPYTNPNAPVHIVTGSAGCKEEHDNFNKTVPAWSAFRSKDYGYTKLKAYNKTHIHLEQISVDKLGQVIDEFWIIKDTHGPF